MSNKFGELLRCDRERRRKTLRDMQARTGLSLSYLCELETGADVNPSVATLSALRRGYDVSALALMRAALHDFEAKKDHP